MFDHGVLPAAIPRRTIAATSITVASQVVAIPAPAARRGRVTVPGEVAAGGPVRSSARRARSAAKATMAVARAVAAPQANKALKSEGDTGFLSAARPNRRRLAPGSRGRDDRPGNIRDLVTRQSETRESKMDQGAERGRGKVS
ncbi:hypothetical protein GCM10007368_38210 [Isoptericola cucumis]|uniref:Uncharacterized protein n=1 Tax=Isoptericola cucumis TaxID=1776856 RepID=A0ABQ2BAI6_9MICO|nr:hypothetical protein GCM10007368_38210 [Isoptericola cucumis]